MDTSCSTSITSDIPGKRLSQSDLLRVNVVGSSGSGKSTFARRLSEELGSPYVEMDRLFWEPNWIGVNAEVLRERLSKAIAGDRWVLDGNYHSKTKDLKWPKTTTIIWLDMSFGRTVWQSATRAIRRAVTQQELWPNTGNRESFRRSFLSRDSIVLWTINNYQGMRRRYITCMPEQRALGKRFVQLRSRRDSVRFFQTLETKGL